MVDKRSERERKFAKLDAELYSSEEREKRIAETESVVRNGLARLQKVSLQMQERAAEDAEIRQLTLKKLRAEVTVPEAIVEEPGESEAKKTGTKKNVQFPKFKQALISHFGLKKVRKSGDYKVSNLNPVRYKDLDIPQSTAGDYFRTCFGTKAIFDQLAGDEDWLVNTLIALEKLAGPTDLRG